jgi:hypothetical protein
MQYGILKVGDTVKYTDEAKRELSSCTDNKEHVVTVIDCNGQHAEGDDWSGADIFWLEIVEKNDADTLAKVLFEQAKNYSTDRPKMQLPAEVSGNPSLQLYPVKNAPKLENQMRKYLLKLVSTDIIRTKAHLEVNRISLKFTFLSAKNKALIRKNIIGLESYITRLEKYKKKLETVNFK